MDFYFEPADDKGMVIMDGDLTVRRAHEMKTILMKAMEKAGHVIVKIERVTDVDLTCLQILCSAHRTFALLNKRLTLTRKFPEIFQETLQVAGFVRFSGCSQSSRKSCLWVEENPL